MMRLAAVIVCAALVFVAPGLAPYAAAADVLLSVKTAVQPLPVGTSQLNVLKGTGSLPVAPGALGVDPTIRTVPRAPVPPAAAPDAQTDDLSQIAKDVAPGL